MIYLFRKRQPRTLLILGLCFLAAGWGLGLVFGWSMQFWPAEEVQKMQQMWKPDTEHLAIELNAYRGGWQQQMLHRVPASFEFETIFFLFFFWKPAGVMLLGMALYKWGALSAKRSAKFYWSLVAAGALGGIPLVLYGVQRNEAAGWSMEWSFFHGQHYNYWGSVLVSLGYLGMVMLLCKSGALSWLTARLAAVGQMAFSEYLLQTFICTTIFYGHGFGYFGSVERSGQILIVLAVWAVQLVVSPLWLRHFRFGPFEWLWRSLTYRCLQQFRRSAPEAVSSEA